MTKNTTLYSLLRNKTFTSFSICKLFCISGAKILQFSLALYTLNLTGSAFIFSTVLSVIVIPRLCLTPIAGVVCDRFSRKKLLTLTTGLFGVVLLFVGLFFDNFIGILPIYVLVICLEIFETFFSTACGTVLPTLFKDDSLGLANSFMTFLDETLDIFNPVLAGILFSLMPIKSIIICLGVLFLGSMLLTTFFSLQQSYEKSSNTSFIVDFKQGLLILKKQPLLLLLITIASLTNLAIAPSFEVTLMYLLNNSYELNSKSTGLILGIISIFGLLSAMLLTHFFPKKHILTICRKISIMLFFMFLMLFLFFSIIDSVFLSLVILISCFGLVISSVTILTILTITLLQNRTENDFLARVISIFNVLATISVPIGLIIYGSVLSQFGIGVTFLLSAFVFLVIFGLIKKYSHLEEQTDEV